MFDGLEITQFTYFQQAGGIELAPTSAELTYGLERLAMVLQKVENVFDLEWVSGVRYRDVRLREEVEQSRYVFGQVSMADGGFAKFHRDLFESHYAFAWTLLESRLVLPALEHCLKCSHIFNVLDASASIGVTERTAFILRVRQLAVAIAKAYVDGGPDTASMRAPAKNVDGP
jgi:glycyl-tRNA synthetase alpha chain